MGRVKLTGVESPAGLEDRNLSNDQEQSIAAAPSIATAGSVATSASVAVAGSVATTGSVAVAGSVGHRGQRRSGGQHRHIRFGRRGGKRGDGRQRRRVREPGHPLRSRCLDVHRHSGVRQVPAVRGLRCVHRLR